MAGAPPAVAAPCSAPARRSSPSRARRGRGAGSPATCSGGPPTTASVETGLVKILRYVTVEDCGPMINPALVAEQVRGAVVQGIGSTLYEHVVYDAEGQLLTRTLMDYLVPGAAEMPDIEVHHLETPSPFTLGGFKGIAEAGTAGAPRGSLDAGSEALAPCGGRLTRPALPPERVRRRPRPD